MTTIDTEKLFNEFGGDAGVRGALVSICDSVPAMDSVSKWRRRGSIPAVYALALLAVKEARQEGPLAIEGYLKGVLKPCRNSNERPVYTGELRDVFE